MYKFHIERKKLSRQTDYTFHTKADSSECVQNISLWLCVGYRVIYILFINIDIFSN